MSYCMSLSKRCLRRIAVVALLLFWAVGAVAQEPWCPEPTNRLVNDYGNVLSPEQRETLEQRLVAFDDSTSNQILVVITPDLHDCEIMDLGTRIGTTWGVGRKDLKNGVVILIKSKVDEDDYGDVAILPGYGLEGALPDIFCKHIIEDEMIDPLSQGDYYGALVAALEVIEPVCTGEYSYERYRQENRRVLFGFVGALILFVVICILLDRYSRKHHHKGGGNFMGGSGTGGFGGFGFGSGLGHGSGGFGGFGSSGGGFGGFGGGSFGGGGAHGRF